MPMDSFGCIPIRSSCLMCLDRLIPWLLGSVITDSPAANTKRQTESCTALSLRFSYAKCSFCERAQNRKATGDICHDFIYNQLRMRACNFRTTVARCQPRRSNSRRTALRLLSFTAALILTYPCTGAPFTFTYTASLSTARSGYTATLLQSGKVLVAGGQDSSGILATAELYDPATGKWTATGSLNTGRRFHTATLLPNGKVLVAAGFDNNTNLDGLVSAEIYDPATGKWTLTGNLNEGRYSHTATLLAGGKVLITGGTSAHSSLVTAELYDSTTGSWINTGQLTNTRQDHTATLLADGTVIVAGGYNQDGGQTISGAEIYNPTTGTWSVTGSLVTARFDHTATLLPSGKVLIGGGNNGTLLASAELYDPASGSWTNTGSLITGRAGHSASLLPNGKVIIAGGNNGGSLASVELYDPASGTWTVTGSMNTARSRHTATLLPNGMLLVACDSQTATAEVFDPADGSSTDTGRLANARFLHKIG